MSVVLSVIERLFLSSCWIHIKKNGEILCCTHCNCNFGNKLTSGIVFHNCSCSGHRISFRKLLSIAINHFNYNRDMVEQDTSIQVARSCKGQ